MRRIKTQLSLGSSMTDNSLNNQMCANISMNSSDTINLQAVADDLAKTSETLINYFGLH